MVTREYFRNQGRLTDLMANDKLFDDIGLKRFNFETDRFIICGNSSMLKDCCGILDSYGFKESRHGY